MTNGCSCSRWDRRLWCRLPPKVWWLKGVGRLEWMQVAGEDGG